MGQRSPGKHRVPQKGGGHIAYVTIPKDLTKVKSKLLFGLTKRQLICFGTAALMGVPLFLFLRRSVNETLATLCMIAVMLPLFLLAMYERHGQPLEVVLGQIIEFQFLRQKQRPYQTNNFYATVEKQIQLEQEVNNIVRPYKKALSGQTPDRKRSPTQTGTKARTNPDSKRKE